MTKHWKGYKITWLIFRHAVTPDFRLAAWPFYVYTARKGLKNEYYMGIKTLEHPRDFEILQPLRLPE